jgi:hypothetical protein
MTDTNEKEIEVKSRPPYRRPTPSYISQEIIDYFHSIECRIGLRGAHSINHGRDDALGWRRIRLDELPEEIQKLFMESFEIRDGCIYRADWVVCKRSFDADLAQKTEEEMQRLAMESPTYLLEELDDKVSGLAKSTGGSPGIGVALGILDHIPAEQVLRAPGDDAIGGKAAIIEGLTDDHEDILKAVEERRKDK